MAAVRVAPESGEDRGTPEASEVPAGSERPSDLHLHSGFLVDGYGDGGEDDLGCEVACDPYTGVPYQGEALGGTPRDSGADRHGEAGLGAGHIQGPVEAADPTATLPPDIQAWGRLARELLIQAARDVEGRGYAETTVDQRDAKRFFYSMAPERVYYRTLWFGMAGIPMPNHHGMPALVHRLVRSSRAIRKIEQGEAG